MIMENKNYIWRPVSEYTGGRVLATNGLDVIIGEINSEGDCESEENGSTILCGVTGFIKIEEMLPELKESKENEDEKIRKALIRFHKSTIDVDGIKGKDIIAWLEKQGEQKSYGQRQECVDCQMNYAGECKGSCAMKRGEQKLANKVEPKFKVGDLITNGILVGKIDEIHEFGYHAYFGDHYADVPDIENWHKWTIQDAKDGDILFAKGSYFKEYTFIYSGMTEDNVMSTYCGFDMVHNNFDTKLSRFGRMEDFEAIFPATKEQRDLLFKKMHEASYEWDAEKKELKKIGTTTWSEEDERLFQIVIDVLDRENHLGNITHTDLIACVRKLKSIKDRYTWKPSDEQMGALANACDGKILNLDYLNSLYQDLKKLNCIY